MAGAAWDGERVWLVDVEGRLIAVDGATGVVALDRRLEIGPVEPAGLTPIGQQLVGFGFDASRAVRIVRVDTASMEITDALVDAGVPVGQATVIEDSLIVADFRRGVVSVDVSSATTKVLVNPGLAANLVQGALDGTFWVVDDRRRQLVRVNGEGRRLVDERRPDDIGGLAADNAGNAWLAERTRVTVIGPMGGVAQEFEGFTNAGRISACSGSIVVSDIDTGEIAWLSASAAPRRVRTGTPGAVVACTSDGVWYLTIDGDLFRLREP